MTPATFWINGMWVWIVAVTALMLLTGDGSCNDCGAFGGGGGDAW
jgi:hypothetical protein